MSAALSQGPAVFDRPSQGLSPFPFRKAHVWSAAAVTVLGGPGASDSVPSSPMANSNLLPQALGWGGERVLTASTALSSRTPQPQPPPRLLRIAAVCSPTCVCTGHWCAGLPGAEVCTGSSVTVQ